MLNNNTRRRRVIDLDSITLVNQDTLLKRLEEVSVFLGQNPRMTRNKSKMEEVGLFLDCMEAINERGGINSKDAYYKIFSLRAKYFKEDS